MTVTSSRARGDRQSWLRGVPNHWGVAPLGVHFDERKVTVNDTDFPPLSVTKAGVVPQLDDVAKTNNNDARKLVRAGDFVINSRSDRRGSAGLADRDGSVSVINTVLRPRASVDRRFVHHLLRCDAFQQEFYRWGSGIVADLWSTRYSAMKAIPIAIPPLCEQGAIADFLDHETVKIDTLAAEQQGLVQVLIERRLALVERAVTRGLMAGATFAPSPIEWIPESPLHWDTGRMKNDTRMLAGGTPDTDDQTMWAVPGEEGTPWVAIGDMSQRDRVCSAKKFVTSAGIAAKRLPVGDVGTLLLAMYASVGEVAHLGIKATWNQALLGITPTAERFDSRYLAYTLRSMRQFMMRDVRSNTQANLNAGQVGDFWLPRPPLQEQGEIADYLDDQTLRIDALIAEARGLVSVVKERRSAMITAAVTGQIDPRGEVA